METFARILADSPAPAPSGPAYYFTAPEFPINDDIVKSSFGVNPLYNRFYDYEWIFIASILGSFFAAFALGSNDVANSFAPSVGAKTLTLWQACAVAAVCEFLGAFLLGARSTDTIKSKIVSLTAFQGNDDLLMFGMLCADLAAGTWMTTATFFELHVSSTHSVIGAVMGFSMVTPIGVKAINWEKVGLIMGSWVIAPIVSGMMSALMFLATRYFVLRRENSFERALVFYPLIIWFTIALNLSFIFVKSAIANGVVKLSQGEVVGISIGVGFGVALISYFTLIPFIRRRYINYPEEAPQDTERKAAKAAAENDNSNDEDLWVQEKDNTEKVDVEAGGEDAKNELALEDAQKKEEASVSIDGDKKPQPEKKTSMRMNDKKDESGNILTRASQLGENAVHGVVMTDKKINNMHDIAEVFSYRTECVFSLVQVLTACCASFAHGANDVANAVGPLASVASIYSTGSLAAASKVAVPDWILLLGASGIVLGLSTVGYKILRVMGVKVAKLTPSRGYAIELGASFIILIFSTSGIPLSTTHCSTGSTVAIGLCEWKKGSVNWKVLRKIFAAWVSTIFMAGAISAFFFSFATFAPSQIYPLSESNCLYLYGQVYNATVTGDANPVCIPLVNNTVSIIAGYPSTGKFYDIPNA